ncbi:hypothetical protein M9458_028114, partial [Cirrhinus mrigala]
LSPEEIERRRIRRERNKMAAAKCRNRRRELTDTLQSETDQLEDEKSRLQKEIAELQKEKEKLEPICKVQDSDSDSDSNSDLPTLSGIKIEPVDPDLPGPSRESKSYAKPSKPKPKITIPPSAPASTVTSIPLDSESLHTPVLISTPSLTPFTASLVFSYPSSSMDTSSATSSQALNLAGSHSTSQSSHNPQPCGVAHRRSSSSGDQSDHSLNSPTILTL